MNEDLLRFWFGTEVAFREEWFGKSSDFDDEVRRRFADRLESNMELRPHTPRDRLGLIVLFDQVARNIYRDDARRFAYDHRALGLARGSPLVADCGPFHPYEAYFYMLPFEHSENTHDQGVFLRFVDETLRACPGASSAFVDKAREIAVRHGDVIRRFGRFPHRNRVLGRRSSHDEEQFLAQPGSGF